MKRSEVVLSTLTPPELEALDYLRGEITRSSFLRNALYNMRGFRQAVSLFADGASVETRIVKPRNAVERILSIFGDGR